MSSTRKRIIVVAVPDCYVVTQNDSEFGNLIAFKGALHKKSKMPSTAVGGFLKSCLLPIASKTFHALATKAEFYNSRLVRKRVKFFGGRLY